MKFLKIFLIFLLTYSFQNKSFSEINVDARYVIIQDHLSQKILYEKHADEIMDAIRSGKFIYDVSGSAR